MNQLTLHAATYDTLADLFALHPDPADVPERLARLRERVQSGAVRLADLLIVRSERGVEGAALIPVPPQVPVFPRVREDAPEAALTLLARGVLDRCTAERQIVLQDDHTPLHEAALNAAGWERAGSGAHVMYETDLRARTYALEPRAVEGSAELRARPDVHDLLVALNAGDWICEDGWLMVVLPDERGELVAAGAVRPSNRPGYVNVNMLGVRPEARGQGLGARLHAHLLARAAETYTHHAGGTEETNAAMRRLFEKHGSRLACRQLYFRQKRELEAEPAF